MRFHVLLLIILVDVFFKQLSNVLTIITALEGSTLLVLLGIILEVTVLIA